MRFESSERSPESNIPVSLFNYGETSKFVRVWEDYEDTIDNVCLAFGISRTEGNISLQTSALDICKGRDVTVDKSAYPLMWTFLDEMAVSVDSQQREEAAGSPRRAENGLEWVTPTSPLDTPDPDEAPIPITSSIPQDDVGSLPVEEQVPTEKRWEDQIWEEEINEEPISPVEENTHHEPPAKDLEPEAEIPAPRNMKFKAAVIDSGSSSTTHNDVFPRIKQEKFSQSLNEEAPRRERSPKKDNQTIPSSEDPRFEITIIGPGGAYAQFKTRGKHQVRKVLAAACKTFDMDESHSELVLSLSVEDDEGEMQDHNFVCAPEETIQGSGVNVGSKLYLRTRAKNADNGLD